MSGFQPSSRQAAPSRVNLPGAISVLPLNQACSPGADWIVTGLAMLPRDSRYSPPRTTIVVITPPLARLSAAPTVRSGALSVPGLASFPRVADTCTALAAGGAAIAWVAMSIPIALPTASEQTTNLL